MPPIPPAAPSQPPVRGDSFQYRRRAPGSGDPRLRRASFEGLTGRIRMSRARELGMDRAITRRDFLNGIAVAALVGTARRGEASPLPADYYPPALTGLRGSHVGSFEVAHRLRDGDFQDFPR